MSSVLFVCLGNICRSPCAEGVLTHMVKSRNLDINVESCGLGDWHKGALPDYRMRKTAESRGVILSSRAREFQPHFFDEFDYIFAADKSVLFDLHKRAKTLEHKAKIHLVTHYSTLYKDQEIPDPFHQGDAHFELVMDMIEESCECFLEHLRESNK